MISGIASSILRPVVAGDANCETDPDDPRCTGEKGAGGMNFCVPGDRFGDCYDADFSTIDCDEHQNHSRCSGFQGRDGNIFCDIQYEDLGYDTILHTHFNKTVTADPMAVTAASDDLVNDYREIHEETSRFNIECADAGYNIPKF